MTIASIPARTAGPHPRLPACDSSCVVHFGPQRGPHARVSSGYERAPGACTCRSTRPSACRWLSSQAENHGDGSGAILGARSAEQGCTSANGYGPSVVGPSVKERRNGSFRTCDRDLRIRRLGVRIPPGAPVFTLVRTLKPAKLGRQTRPSGPNDSNADSNAVKFGWTRTRSIAFAAARRAVGITWE
jgi:hypothetical protein